MPEVLTLRDGKRVTPIELWWQQRRPEIAEDFEREVIGRVPKHVPKVTWTVVSNVVDGLVGTLAANGKRLVGHVDNSACPAITVDIRLTVVTPAKAKGPVPLLMTAAGTGEPALISTQGGRANRTFGDARPTALVSRYRLLALDLVGHGESGTQWKKWAIPEFAADVSRLSRRGQDPRIGLPWDSGATSLLPCPRDRFSGPALFRSDRHSDE